MENKTWLERQLTKGTRSRYQEHLRELEIAVMEEQGLMLEAAGIRVTLGPTQVLKMRLIKQGTLALKRRKSNK